MVGREVGLWGEGWERLKYCTISFTVSSIVEVRGERAKRKDPFCIEKKGDNVRPFPPGGAPVTSSLSGSFQDPPTKPESNGPLRFAENGHGMFGVPTTRLTL